MSWCLEIIIVPRWTHWRSTRPKMFRELRHEVPLEILVHDEQSGAKIIKPRGSVRKARSRAHLAIAWAHNTPTSIYSWTVAFFSYIIHISCTRNVSKAQGRKSSRWEKIHMTFMRFMVNKVITGHRMSSIPECCWNLGCPSEVFADRMLRRGVITPHQ